MADHNYTEPVKSFGGCADIIECQFTTADTAAITGFATDGGVVSVTRTGVGTFEILFAQGWQKLTPLGLTVGGAAAVQLGRPTIRSITQSTRKVVIATVESDAAPIDIETTGVTIYCAFRRRRS
jgi:hypothetical protein